MDLKYRLITGVDDAKFCERISELLEEGYELHGGPAVSINPNNGRLYVAQAVVRKAYGKDM